MQLFAKMSILNDMPKRIRIDNDRKPQFGNTFYTIYDKLNIGHKVKLGTYNFETKEFEYVYPATLKHGYVETRIIKLNGARDICCSDDTEIWTNDGWKRADKIWVGDKVFIPTMVWANVNKVLNDRVIRSVFEVTLHGANNLVTRAGFIKCGDPPEHLQH